jgi:predicted permease
MSELFRRLRYLVHRRRFDQELAGDLEFHREMAAREGRNFGNALRLREEARDAWGWTWIDRLSQDLRYAARMLRKSPGFTTAAVAMLALGIGVNVAAFGFFDLMFLRPLPVRDPGSILQFQRSAPRNFSDNFIYPEVAFYREHAKTLSAVVAASHSELTIEDEQKQLDVSFVTANYFNELGARARLGTMLDPAQDESSGAGPVVVLGQRFWERHFGADPSIVGKTIRLNNRPAIVVGVVSSEFSGLGIGLGRPDLWAPIAQEPYFVKGSQITDFSDRGIGVLMWGRLQPGVTPRVAEEELRSLAAELHREHPHDVWENESLPSKPGGYAGSIRHEMYPVFALMGALGFLILATACTNLGSLLLARSAARKREISIRIAVGAGRARLVRQLFTESLLLALVGAAAGLGLGYVVLRGLLAWAEVPVWLDPTPDRRVMVFAIGMGFAASILFGLTPAWQGGRQRHRGTTTRQFLIAAQVAASCVLLIVAGLLVRALDRAMFAPQGFEYQQVISIDPHFHGSSPDDARVYLDTLESRLRTLPGIEAVAMVSNPPLGNRWTVVRAEAAGRAVDIHYNHIDPPFFQTMGIPLVRGRNLMRGDTGGIIISESLARFEWPREDPIGKLFQVGVDAAGVPEKRMVVGVSGSARLVSPEDSDAVEIYELPGAEILPSMVVLVRTAGPPESVVGSVAAVASAIDTKMFPEVQLMKNAYREKVRTAEFSALSVGVLGLVALLLACTGIVGLVAYTVAQRTKEIGIRMALGARPSHVVSVVLRQFSIPVAAGLLAGVAGAVALSQILRGLLYGISNLDPISYPAAVGILAATVALAALLPARRALRVDPMGALRHE